MSELLLCAILENFTGYVVDPDINDNSPWFEPGTFHEFRLTYTRNDDVGCFHLESALTFGKDTKGDNVQVLRCSLFYCDIGLL